MDAQLFDDFDLFLSIDQKIKINFHAKKKILNGLVSMKKKKKSNFAMVGLISMEISILIPYKECLNEYKFYKKYNQAKVGWLIISIQIQFIPFLYFPPLFRLLARSIASDALYIQIFWCKYLSRYKIQNRSYIIF